MSELLRSLRENKEFHAVMDDMAKLRPIIPIYRSCASPEDEQGLLVQMRAAAGRQEGFDVLYMALTGKRP